MLEIRTSFRLSAIFIALAFVGSAHAAVIFNNLGPGNSFSAGGRIVQGPAVGTIGDVNQAAQFTVGPTDAFLTSISLGMNVNDPPNSGTGPIDIVLAADAGGAPGATIRTLSTNAGVTGEQLIVVADDGSQLLSANTSYWVIADGEGTFDGSWRSNSIGDMGITAGQTEPNPWNVRPIEDRYAFRVEGRFVPEPGALPLLGVAMLGLVRLRRP